MPHSLTSSTDQSKEHPTLAIAIVGNACQGAAKYLCCQKQHR
jgi:hypothetical protein